MYPVREPRDKFSRKWWEQFVSKTHYWENVPILANLKLQDYLGFFRNITLSHNLILKTDLYVEAKDFGDNYLPHLKDGNSFVGMDISFRTVQMARESQKQRLCKMEFVVADARHLPFKEDAFDAVISDSTLDHLPPKLLPHAISELARILRNGGKLILSLNNIYNIPAAVIRRINYLRNPYWFFAFSTSLRKALSILRRAGFRIRRHDYILPYHFMEILLLKLSYDTNIGTAMACRWVVLFRKIMRKTMLRKFACLQFIILAEKGTG